jgi:hypothetical protein
LFIALMSKEIDLRKCQPWQPMLHVRQSFAEDIVLTTAHFSSTKWKMLCCLSDFSTD